MIPLRLERQPDLRVPARESLEQERGVGAHSATALDNRIEPLKRDVHSPRGFNLRHAEGLQELLEQDLRGCVGGRWVGSISTSSVIGCATHVVRVGPFEAKSNSVPIVDTNRMIAGEVAG